MANQYHFYPDNKGEYRWKIIADNGRTVGSSGEGFKNLQSAVRNAQDNGYQGEGKRNVTRKGDKK